MTAAPPNRGIVLSGGGARGAYEVGLVAGIVEVLGLGPEDAAPFSIFAGTSVGAINATFLAANAHRGDMNVEELVRAWTSLRLSEHLRIDAFGFLGWPRKLPLLRRRHQLDPEHIGPTYGRSLLDPRPLHGVVRDTIPWSQLHRNAESGVVRALIITALHIGTGRTHMFTELAPGATFRPSPDPSRCVNREPVTTDHVLASAAIPLVFPARRVGNAYFCDGGLRFNTPLAPAIRAGADRLLVIPLLRGFQTLDDALTHEREEQYPNPLFLAGKLLAALLLDPIDYDLTVLSRFNQLIRMLEQALAPEELERFQSVVVEARGAPYRTIETLHFRPTGDIGRMAGRFLVERGPESRGTFLTERVLRRAASMQESVEADLVSFLLFDGPFAHRLIELGRRDAHLHEEKIHAFFD
jgi:NTE family protein